MKAHPFEAVVIGASAGGLAALSVILPALPANYGLPIVIVVHLPADKKSAMVDILQTKCQLKIKEAEDKEPITSGNVYLAPPDYHLLIEANKKLSLSNEEHVLYSRPSIDVLFESAADAYGSGLIGIVLSGGNNDGSGGLKAIMDAGGMGLVQLPQQAYAAAMPEAALSLCPGALALNLEQIVVYLKEGA